MNQQKSYIYDLLAALHFFIYKHSESFIVDYINKTEVFPFNVRNIHQLDNKPKYFEAYTKAHEIKILTQASTELIIILLSKIQERYRVTIVPRTMTIICAGASRSQAVIPFAESSEPDKDTAAATRWGNPPNETSHNTPKNLAHKIQYHVILAQEDDATEDNCHKGELELKLEDVRSALERKEQFVMMNATDKMLSDL